MKKFFKSSSVRLVLSGLLVPLVFGYILELLVLHFSWAVAQIFLLLYTMAFLLIWSICATLAADPGRDDLLQSFLMCAPGLVLLIPALLPSSVALSNNIWLTLPLALSRTYYEPAVFLNIILSPFYERALGFIACAIILLVMFSLSRVCIRVKR